MKFVKLVWVNLTRNLRRSILTVLSVAVALFLFSTLRTVVTTLQNAGEVGSEARLITRSGMGITFPLPEAYGQRLATFDGVQSVSWANWFGGVYVDTRNFFAQFGVDAKTYFAMYPEIQVPPDQLETFMGERTAAVAGVGLMERFGIPPPMSRNCLTARHCRDFFSR